MAQLKDSLITGDLRVTGTIYGDVPLDDLVDADDLKAIEALSGSGIPVRTGNNTWTINASVPPSAHAHGNLTSEGKVGTDANKAIYTGTGGAIQAGTLPVAGGGTGAATLPANKILLGNDTTAIKTGNINYTEAAGSKSGTKYMLRIWGTAEGNTAANLVSQTAGVLRFNDPGPQIQFGTSETGGQQGALIFTDHDSAGTGVSWHFVASEGDNNNGGNGTVTAPRFRARAGLTVGQNTDDTSYTFKVNGTSRLNGNATVAGNLYFPSANILEWNDGTYRQKITITDDSTANTAVFSFAQSANSGSTYTDLFVIKDNGTVTATTFSGALDGNASTATKWASAQTVYVTLGTASTSTTIQGGSSTAQTIGVNGTLGVANGGTGATSFTANSAIISGSTTTGSFTTRAIKNNTSATAAANNSTDLITQNTLYYATASINNARQTSSVSIYAPTSAGTSGYILKSSGGTSAPVWLQTLPVSNGGTGATSFTANSIIMSGSTTTAALTTRAITNNTSNTAITNNNTNIPTMNTIYYGLVTVNNASQTRATGIYAPTSAGTANQVLVSAGGTSAPTWATPEWTTVQIVRW